MKHIFHLSETKSSLKSLERNWKLIRDEGLMVMDKAKGLFLPEDENLREKGDWSQFTLWQQGEPLASRLSSACSDQVTSGGSLLLTKLPGKPRVLICTHCF